MEKWYLLTCSPWHVHLALKQPRTTCPRVAPLHSGLVPHTSAIKKMPIDMSSGQSNGGFLFPGYFCSWYHGKDQPAHHTRIFDSKIST